MLVEVYEGVENTGKLNRVSRDRERYEKYGFKVEVVYLEPEETHGYNWFKTVIEKYKNLKVDILLFCNLLAGYIYGNTDRKPAISMFELRKLLSEDISRVYFSFISNWKSYESSNATVNTEIVKHKQGHYRSILDTLYEPVLHRTKAIVNILYIKYQ